MHNKGRSTVWGYCQEAESTGLADRLNLESNGKQEIKNNPHISGWSNWL